MNKLYSDFVSLSEKDQYDLFDKIKNYINIKREENFLKQIKTDFDIEIIKINNKNYFILSNDDMNYKIILFAEDTLKIGINLDNSYTIVSHFKNMSKTIINKNVLLYYRCRECDKDGDSNSDIDTYFEEYKDCLKCKNKFLSVKCNIPNDQILYFFYNYNTTYINEFNELSKIIYNFKNILENKCLPV